jgi:alpha-L-arabinofuranosidase
MVNVLHAILLTDEDKCIRTSTYYAFELAKPHCGKQALKLETADPAPLGLSVSASRKGKDLVATFVNPKHDTAMAVECTLAGANAAEATARILHDEDYNACNTFQQPGRLTPKAHAVSTGGGILRMELPPLSVATAMVRLS